MILSLFQPLLSATTTTPRSLYTFWEPCSAIYQLVLSLRNVSFTKVVSTRLAAGTFQNWCLVEDRAVMTCLTAVLTLKAAVPVNTGFANRKWLEMPIEAKADQQRNLAAALE
jgi:hypothetical protein